MVSNKLSIAEHLLNSTYTTLKDPKILISVCQNILSALEEAMTVSLDLAREQKEIPAYQDSLNGKLDAFRKYLAHEKGVTPIDFMFISELQELIYQHEQSPMEFRRNDAFVIADEDYRLHTLTEQKAKTFIARGRSLLTRL